MVFLTILLFQPIIDRLKVDAIVIEKNDPGSSGFAILCFLGIDFGGSFWGRILDFHLLEDQKPYKTNVFSAFSHLGGPKTL